MGYIKSASDIKCVNMETGEVKILNGVVNIQEVGEIMNRITWDNYSLNTIETTKSNNNEWIWITAYKGTDKNMCCRGFQYNMDEEFVMPEEKVEVCHAGFHACKSPTDTRTYYGDIFNDRYFEVKLLIRKNENYGGKVVGRSIRFIRELSDKEIYDNIVCDTAYTVDEFIKMKANHWDNIEVQTYVTYKMFIEFGKQISEYYNEDGVITPIDFSLPFTTIIDIMIHNLNTIRWTKSTREQRNTFVAYLNKLYNIIDNYRRGKNG